MNLEPLPYHYKTLMGQTTWRREHKEQAEVLSTQFTWVWGLVFNVWALLFDSWENNPPGRRKAAKRKWNSLRKNGNDSIAPQDRAKWEGSQDKWSEAVYETARPGLSARCLLSEAIADRPAPPSSTPPPQRALAQRELPVSPRQETGLDLHFVRSVWSTSTQDCICARLLGCHGKWAWE